jgi:hypothetical protein
MIIKKAIKKISNVEAGAILTPIIKGRKRFCPECGERLTKEKRTDWSKNEYFVWVCYGLVDPEHNDLPLAECPYEYKCWYNDVAIVRQN